MRSFWGLVFAIFVSFAFAQEQHGVVFPLTETATTYNAADNYYDTSDEGSVRFSYTPSKTGYCSVYSSEHNSKFYRYLYSYGTDATFSQIEEYDNDYFTAYLSFICNAGETYYFIVDVNNDYSYEFDMKVTLQDISIVTIQGKTEPDTVVKGKSFDISATVPADKRFMGWKIESGTGSFDNKKFKSTEFTPTSDKVTLSYDIEDAAVYEITKTASSYTPAEHYYSNPYSDVRLYFVAPSDGGYIINVKKTALSSYYVYRYSSGDFGSYNKYSIASSEWADTLLLSK